MGKNKIPDLHYEQILLSEISEEEARKILAEPGSKEKIEQLKESDTKILFNNPPHKIAAQISTRLEKKKKISFKLLVPQLATAAAAAALIIVAIINPASPGRNAGDGNNIKGLAPRLEIFREEPDGANFIFRLLEDGETLHEDDRIQLSYSPAGKLFGVIFSIDGNGYVSMYYPDFISQTPELEKGGKINLDFSLILDNAPLFEKYYFITSDTEFNPQDIIRIAESAAENPARIISETLKLPLELDQYSITFFKEEK